MNLHFAIVIERSASLNMIRSAPRAEPENPKDQYPDCPVKCSQISLIAKSVNCDFALISLSVFHFPRLSLSLAEESAFSITMLGKKKVRNRNERVLKPTREAKNCKGLQIFRYIPGVMTEYP